MKVQMDRLIYWAYIAVALSIGIFTLYAGFSEGLRNGFSGTVTPMSTGAVELSVAVFFLARGKL